MIVTTTDSIEGRRIGMYLGIVAGQAVMGTNIVRDLFAGIRDIVGGRSGSYEKELRKAKAVALDEMVEEARDLGADAIIGVDLDYEHFGHRRALDADGLGQRHCGQIGVVPSCMARRELVPLVEGMHACSVNDPMRPG